MVFTVIRNDFMNALVWLQNWLTYRRLSMRMGMAIRMADMKQRAWNKRYHVMLLELHGEEKLVSVNNDDIYRLKRKKWLPKNFSLLESNASIFYSTPLSRNNRSTVADRTAAKEKYIRYARKYMK